MSNLTDWFKNKGADGQGLSNAQKVGIGAGIAGLTAGGALFLKKQQEKKKAEAENSSITDAISSMGITNDEGNISTGAWIGISIFTLGLIGTVVYIITKK